MRRILWLYLPVGAGILVSIAGQIADLNFKSRLPQLGDLSAMQYATTLVQFPAGIVAVALSLGSLPAISVQAAGERLDEFKNTIALLLRVVLVLMTPAMVGLMVLATPIVVLIFQHGHFTASGTDHTVTALLGYGPQLPFIGIDQLLIAAFYARHSTAIPAAIGVLGVGVYVGLAVLLLGPLSILGLALANTVQIAIHAVILFGLLIGSIGALRYGELLSTLLKVGLAGVAMGLAAWGAERWLSPSGPSVLAHVTDVAVPGVLALAVYGAAMVILRVPEAKYAAGLMGRRFAVTRSRM